MTNGAIYCNRCGTQNSSLAKFCANCGTPFTSDTQELAAAAPPAIEVRPSPQGPAAPMPAVAPAVRYGGFWIRVVAALIDGLAIGIVVFPISAMIALSLSLAGRAVSMPDIGIHVVRGIVGFTFSACANWIYEAWLESSAYQATLGKMALGLKVTDLEGGRVSFARATGRHFAKILSGMILLIGYIMAGLTERKQALHDMIAGTLVVRVQL